ncbi:HAMP domain-containing protein [Paenibacillus sp. 1011MAR3C5]|uniref:sensor histidine kinase n=1 Tax=Paenibacillus sp. 1011MAR3C5 TaxID=1675787 RepID=UPI000E6BC06A|nr:histidine kinase [Paenibacillus sp. 1011MAR3C5]RJE88720.1 HAMP domain-containing protein [Paenibacillus sp. 1011MAR3C5]
MKTLKKLFNNSSLLQKLLVIFLTVTIIPLIFITVFFYDRTEQRLLELTYENMSSSNQQINSNVNAHLNNLRQISSLIYTDENLQAYLTQNYTRDYSFVEAYRYIDGLLYSLLTANNNIASINLYVDNKSLPEDGLFLKHITLENLPLEYLTQLQQTYGNNIFSNVIQDKTGNNVIYLGRILNFNAQSHFYGMVTIGLNEELLYKLIEKEEQNKSVYLLNEKNQIISASDKSLLNLSFSEAIGPELSINQEVVTIDGHPHLLVYNTMPHGWKTVSLTPIDEIMSSSRQTAMQIVVIALFSIVLSILMIIVIAKYLSLRLRKLNRQAAQVEKGNFTVMLTDSSKDEIGQLNAAFNKMSTRLKDMIDKLYVKEIAKRDAELYALQSQINPHFLYNTLSGISSLAIQNDDIEVSKMLNHLARFYQTSLNMGHQYITLEKEIALTKHYLAIQHMRFEDSFIERWEVDESLCKHETLKLLLQPFVENVINHAIYDDQQCLEIFIRIYQSTHAGVPALFLEVEDDGCGMSSEQVETLLSTESKAGYGIKNVHERVQLAYGQNYGVTIQSQAGLGTKITIILPLQQHD